MYEAYCRIFDRCGVPYVTVEAESGPIGGDSSHEFMVPCSTGEDKVLQCVACGYAANQERAEIGAQRQRGGRAARGCPPYEAVATPSKRTIRDVCEFLKVDEATSAKLLVYLADGKPVAALVRGRPRAERGQVPPGARCGACSSRPTRPRSKRRRVLRWVFSGRSRSRFRS